MALKIVTPPAVEPWVSTDAEVQEHLRLIDTSESAWVTLALTKAREQAEIQCRRALINQSWLMTLDKFPMPGAETSSANWYGPSWGTGPGPLTMARLPGVTGYEIWVPKPPLVSVDSIKYRDETGVLQTLDPSLYIVDSVSEPGRIVPAYGAAWPSAQNIANAVQVSFTCGYGSAATAIPAGVRIWMLMLAGTLYENRELIAILNKGQIKELPIFDGMLDDYRVMTFDPPGYWA